MQSRKNIGVLALQGAVEEHIKKLALLENVFPSIVKYPQDLENLHGLIIPGGESTAIGRLLRDFALLSPLQEKIKNGLAVWGTCAGMILLAKEIINDNALHLNVMNISVKRNAYGRQLDSFHTEVIIPEVSDEKIPLVFIRAPYVETAGKNIEILLKINDDIVACRQNRILATSFHPELTDSLAFHKYFAEKIV